MLENWILTILISLGVGSVLVLVATIMLVKHNVHAKIFWNELVLEKITNFVMDQSKEQRILNSVSYNAIKGDPESVLNCIDKYCGQYEWAMNVGDEKGIILDKTVEEAEPTVALEMGTYCGYSAIRIARLLKPNARLLTIEFNSEFIPIAKEIIDIAGLSDKVWMIRVSDLVNGVGRELVGHLVQPQPPPAQAGDPTYTISDIPVSCSSQQDGREVGG